MRCTEVLALGVCSAMVLTSVPIRAATPEEELRNLAEQLGRLQRYRAEIRVDVRDAGAKGPEVRTLHARVEKLDNRELRVFEHLTYLSTPDAVVVVDRARKIVHYGRIGGPTPPEVQLTTPTFPVSAARRLPARVEASTIRQGRRFTVITASGQSASLIFDPASGRLLTVSYPGESGGRVVVEYRWLDAAALNPTSFAVEQFVVADRGVFRAGPACAGYRVVLASQPR
jgi:hypothetical protein